MGRVVPLGSASNRLTFREWSIMVSLGEPGLELLDSHRVLRRAYRSLQRERMREEAKIARDMSRTGIGAGLLSSTGLRRVPPHHLFPVVSNDAA